MLVKHTLEPVYNNNSKILILGSIPSVKSREYNFYYAHKQNRFWKVLEIIFNEKILDNIEYKKEFLYKHNIALFDVIKSCEIIGSKDSTIRNVKANNINKIIKNSNIKTIFTTGKKSYNLYIKYCYKNTKILPIYLPSTSPANIGNYSLEDLVNKYKVILDYI